MDMHRKKYRIKALIKKTGQNFQEIYNFNRLWRVKEARLRSEKYDENLQLRQKKTLRSSLDINEKVLVLAERLRKKMHLGNYIKAQLKIDCFLIETEFSP